MRPLQFVKTKNKTGKYPCSQFYKMQHGDPQFYCSNQYLLGYALVTRSLSMLSLLQTYLVTDTVLVATEGYCTSGIKQTNNITHRLKTVCCTYKCVNVYQMTLVLSGNDYDGYSQVSSSTSFAASKLPIYNLPLQLIRL